MDHQEISFAQSVKKEILQKEIQHTCCQHAMAYGIACFARVFDESGFVLHTETTAVAQYARRLFSSLDITGKVYVKGKQETRIYEFCVRDAVQIESLLKKFFYTSESVAMRINSKNFLCEQCTSAFVAGAFLASGTMTNPKKEYTLEISSPRYHLMQDFQALLTGRGFLPKITQRKGNYVLYFKASEQIEDMLTYMGAPMSALEIMNTKVLKDFRNKANRITNCETANIDKIVRANTQTLQAIAYLRQCDAFETLPQQIKQAALLREEHPDLSLKELAECFEPPLSKSGISHRMKKIEQMAQSLKERRQND